MLRVGLTWLTGQRVMCGAEAVYAMWQSRALSCRLLLRVAWLAAASPQACLLVLPLLTELSQQQQLAHLAHLPALSHLLGALQATLNDAADPSADMVVSYRELPWRHGQLLLQVASGELPVLRWGSRGRCCVCVQGGCSPEGSARVVLVLACVLPVLVSVACVFAPAVSVVRGLRPAPARACLLCWRRSRGLLELSSDSLPGVEGDTLALLPGLREALVWRLQALAEQHK